MAKEKAQYHIRTSDLDSGVIRVDDTLRIHHFNKWLEIYTNKKEEDLLGLKLTDVFKNINEKTLLRKIKTASRLNTPTYYIASTSKYLIPIKIDQIKNSYFEYMQQDVRIMPSNDDSNIVTILINDQTIMANTNMLLEANIQKVKELNSELLKEKEITKLHHEKLLSNSRSAAMGEMISMIAHQWRQPLSLINTLIATMRIKKELNLLDKDEMDKSFDKIESTINFLSETIDDFRDYFKPNKLISEVYLNELFNKSISFLKDEMEHLSIKYLINVDSNIKIYTYKNELLQSLINIFKNSIDAFKYISTDDKRIEVKVNYQQTNIIISIEDNAGGIPADILQKIFEPYFSTKNKNGTGLGLYMCKTIIQKNLQGDINITSKDGVTQTVIQLPIKITNNKESLDENSMSTLS